VASVGMLAFLRQGLKMYYADRARLMINRDIRSFTGKMDSDAVTANFFCLYLDYNTRSSGSPATDAFLVDGQVGDFLVLVYTDPALTSSGVSMITDLVGYYREITDTTLNTGPVHRFTCHLGTAVDAKTTAIFTILANTTNSAACAASDKIVTQLAQGLATTTTLSGVDEVGVTTTNPRLFYNRQNRSIMVRAQIAESLNEVKTSTSNVGNTYNFTVSPRG